MQIEVTPWLTNPKIYCYYSLGNEFSPFGQKCKGISVFKPSAGFVLNNEIQNTHLTTCFTCILGLAKNHLCWCDCRGSPILTRKIPHLQIHMPKTVVVETVLVILGPPVLRLFQIVMNHNKSNRRFKNRDTFKIWQKLGLR